MRYFAEADRLAAGLGAVELREHLAAADAEITRARWTGLIARLVVTALVTAAVVIIGLSDMTWPLKALLGMGAFALVVTPVIVVGRWPSRPVMAAPVPDATPDALMDAVDAAFRALKPRHRSLGRVVHARAFAARVWAEARGELPDADPPRPPFGRRRKRAAQWLHSLVHRTATDESCDRLTLARLDRALLLVSTPSRMNLVWTAIGVLGMTMAVAGPDHPYVMVLGYGPVITASIGAGMELALPDCPVAGWRVRPRDREEALREIAEAFPGLRDLVRP
ncbi:hypothetical protein Afil01_18080 [Actinorhabdospora filicis]|uniref:Uncharacterized protein n=1 Tax=Actinorhabdospora filicis TaxID=1785913 RepID=A0A9W6W901_9ACTN|nr:hypothetical protein [Actinorhabdospora filicis]GLZ77001.1 hypothetical protein Afil01_18080 [Actinorhabdospora filicis]